MPREAPRRIHFVAATPARRFYLPARMSRTTRSAQRQQRMPYGTLRRVTPVMMRCVLLVLRDTAAADAARQDARCPRKRYAARHAAQRKVATARLRRPYQQRPFTPVKHLHFSMPAHARQCVCARRRLTAIPGSTGKIWRL